MKNGPNSAAVGRAPEAEEFVSRKLIRPTLPKSEDRERSTTATASEVRSRQEKPAFSKRGPAVEQTHAEEFYFQKQMQAKTLMTLVLKNGESVQGVIEWYDKQSIKLNRVGKPNLLIYKPSIRYIHKSDESR
jgi:host factor-I protein